MSTFDASRSEEGYVSDPPEQHPEAAFITTELRCASCDESLLGLSTLGMCPSCGTTVRATLIKAERQRADSQRAGEARQTAHCARCGYDLQGLDDEGFCPECGTSIALSRRGALLSLASPEYLRTVHNGLVVVLTSVFVVLFASILTAVFFFFGAAAQSNAMLALAIVMLLLIPAGSIGWMCGWWMFTARDPQFDDVRERSVARGRSRFYLVAYLILIASAFALIFVGPALLVQSHRRAVGVLFLLGLLALLLSFVALVLQYVFSMLYVRWMALRIPNQSLAGWAKTLTWLGPVIYIAASFFVIGPLISLGIYWSLLDNVRREIKAIRKRNADAAAGYSY